MYLCIIISILFLSTRAKHRLAYQHIISAVYNLFVAWDSCIKTSVAQHVHKISVGLLLVTGVALVGSGCVQKKVFGDCGPCDAN